MLSYVVRVQIEVLRAALYGESRTKFALAADEIDNLRLAGVRDGDLGPGKPGENGYGVY